MSNYIAPSVKKIVLLWIW